MVKSETNLKRSKSMKQHWLKNRDSMMLLRQAKAVESKEKAGSKIKQHFLDHPEHRASISVAQKIKWIKYKKAVKYCEQNGVEL